MNRTIVEPLNNLLTEHRNACQSKLFKKDYGDCWWPAVLFIIFFSSNGTKLARKRDIVRGVGKCNEKLYMRRPTLVNAHGVALLCDNTRPHVVAIKVIILNQL